MKKYIYLLLFLVVSFSISAQVKQDSVKKNELTVSSLNQPKSSYFPQNLGPNVNTVDYAELNPVISPDGKTLYFSRANHPENTWGKHESQDIWYSEKQSNGTWSTAQRMPDHLNVGKYNALLSISKDGKTILLSGQYSKRGHWKRRGFCIANKNGNEWSRPQKIKIPKYKRKNRGIHSAASMSFNSDVIVMSFTKKFNGHVLDLYVSVKKDDKWRKLKKIKGVNSKFHSEEAPFLSADGKTLYYSSIHRKGSDGKFDIYKASRLDDSYRHWSKPVLLSDTINSKDYDSYFKTNLIGSYAYFSSNRSVEKPTHHKHHHALPDIFGVKLFEENPYAVISGRIMNVKTNKVFTLKNPVPVLVDGKPADSIKFNTDSSLFTLKLKLGKEYEVKPVVENYLCIPTKIDLTKYNEFTTLKQDLSISPIPYSKVAGNTYQKETINLIPTSSNPKIVLNGKVQDSIKINSETGKYSIMLENGKMHQLEVIADKFISYPVTIDLKNSPTYTEVNQTLYAELRKAKSLKLSGKVIDRKTNKILNPSIPVSIMVDGNPVAANYMSSTGEYSYELLQGKTYTVNAKVSGYLPVYEQVYVAEGNENVLMVKDLMVSPIEVGSSVKINNIFFETGKSNLKPASFVEIDRMYDFLKENPQIKGEIQGHTDNVGKPENNKKLSQARAQAVTDYLVSKGLDPARLTSKGYGATLPVADNKTTQGKAANRRVEFKITDH